MNKFWIMLGHTYFSKLKTKSFIISTVITLLFIVGLTNINHIISLFDKEELKEITVIDETKALYPLFEQQMTAYADIEVQQSKKSVSDLKEDVLNDDLTGYLVLNTDEGGLPTATYYAKSITDSELHRAIEQSLQQMKLAIGTKQLGVEAEKLQQLFIPVEMEKVALLETAKSEEELDQARGLVYILLFVIYFAVIMYANMIAMEVATEKSSRVMEILVSSMAPIQQMFAKILGIALLSLTQFVLIAAVGFASMKINSDNNQSIEGFFQFSDVPIQTFSYAIVFFVLGYFLYATLAAFLGSLVSKIEDVQQMITPLTFVVVAAFMIAMFGLSSPEATFIKVTSFIPFFAPMIMFLRVGMVHVPIWEIALSIGLLVLTIGLLTWFGAKVYKGGVLLYGKSSSFKDIKKAIQIIKER
ncbi:ABC transporter permease [Bacillus sp. FJAT-47783]|uniref:ABC transporter permease n=1 Tax=Bacillus sp. FJAT-47783 TaxID=2922712 RepID=UPI001FADB266|nr:ABC transporter permease [Bacillus sp. FJAT-47783]